MGRKDKKIQIKKFISGLALLEPVEFLGIAKILGIKLEKDKAPLLFNDLFLQITRKFESLREKKREEILQLIIAATALEPQSTDQLDLEDSGKEES